jgi:hypothetical protein
MDYQLLRNLRKLHGSWAHMSDSEKRIFIDDRIKTLKNKENIDIKRIETNKKSFLWGNNYTTYKYFCDYLFFDNSECLYVNLNPYFKSYYVWEDSRNLSLFISNEPLYFADKLIKDKHVVFNSEALYLYLSKYGDFISNVFDESCVFCFTGSTLKDEHRTLFLKNGIKNIKDYMRCWDGGATFYTCRYYNKHWLDYLSDIHVENNELISTDLWNNAQLFIDYKNGDKIYWERKGKCECGLPIDDIKFLDNDKILNIKSIDISYNEIRQEVLQHVDLNFMYIGYTKEKIIVNIVSSSEKDSFRNYKWQKEKEMLAKGISLEFKFCLFPKYSTKLEYFVKI